MQNKRKPQQRSLWRVILPFVVILGLIAITIVMILALLGPTVGNVFSNISKGLSRDGGGGSYVAAPPAPPVVPQITNPIETTAQDSLSTFAMDVDTASYTFARSSLLAYNQLPSVDAIRAEEFINYLPSTYPSPTDGSAFAIHMAAAPSPFAEPDKLLMRVGIQGQRIAPQDRAPATLIFVIDISGSMADANRLPLVKETLAVLVTQLREDDKVGIVVYADSARVILSPTSASQKETILNAINSLNTEGSTYAEAGLLLGYSEARANLRPDGTTRVILLSDGVANVGATGPDQILQTIRKGVEEGITLTTV